MNTNPLDVELRCIDLDKAPCVLLRVVHGEEVSAHYTTLLNNLVDWAKSYDPRNYDLFCPANPDEEMMFEGNTMMLADDFHGLGPASYNNFRLIWRDFVMGWEKHTHRDLSVNRLLTPEEQQQLLSECKAELLAFFTKSKETNEGEQA